MNFTFTEQELNVILNALQELPFKLSASVISSISNQIQENNKPKDEPKPEVSEAANPAIIKEEKK